MKLLFYLTKIKNLIMTSTSAAGILTELRIFLQWNANQLTEKEIESILEMFELTIQESTFVIINQDWIYKGWANKHRTYFTEKSADFPEIQKEFEESNYEPDLILRLIQELKIRKSHFNPALRIPEVFVFEDLQTEKQDLKNLKELFVRVIEKMIQDRLYG